MNQKILSLAEFLNVSAETITESTYDDSVFEVEKHEYLVLDSREREERVSVYIKESIEWFEPYFLTELTGIPAEMFSCLQNGNCKNAHEAVLRCIESTCGMQAAIDAAINADGYGFFLNSYDGTDDEITYRDDGKTHFMFIYQVQ